VDIFFDIGFIPEDMGEVTLQATHRYQYEVLRQRSDTRDELGFERRWCW